MSAMALAPEGPRTLVLEATAEAPRIARRFLGACFAEWGIGDDYLGRLVVCELVTNAHRHGEGPIVVRLYLDEGDGRPVVEVEDSGEGRPVVRPPDDRAPSGRGLLLVAGFLRGCWGVRPLSGGGKAVWAKLPGCGAE
jgi:anti-sigma regulatory factor (Ser/Thr protein kinase)